jgi:hypothetical protein
MRCFWAYLHWNSIQALLLNVLGGILAAISWELGKWLLERLSKLNFKRVFGAARSMYLVYGSFNIRSGASTPPSGFQLVKEADPSHAFAAKHVASSSEVRAAAYLSHCLSVDGSAVGLFEADEELEPRLDIDFVAFGALSNLKTLDCFKNASNDLCEFDLSRGFFVWKGTHTELCEKQPGKDYGVVLKIHPSQFPDRTWIACAGLGEWGTSGGAWFLANKWKQLKDRVNTERNFVAIVAVEPTKDESAVLVGAWNERPK